MAIQRLYCGSATVTSTEFSLINGSTTSADLTSTGIWQVYVDWTNLDDSTFYQIKMKDRFTTAGPQVTIFNEVVGHAQGSAPGEAIPALAMGSGMDVSLTMVTGSATVIAYQLWKIA